MGWTTRKCQYLIKSETTLIYGLNNSKNCMHKVHSLVSTQNSEINTFGNNMHCKLGVSDLNNILQ